MIRNVIFYFTRTMLGTNSTQIEFTLLHSVPMNGPLVDSPLTAVLGLQTYAVPVKDTT